MASDQSAGKNEGGNKYTKKTGNVNFQIDISWRIQYYGLPMTGQI